MLYKSKSVYKICVYKTCAVAEVQSLCTACYWAQFRIIQNVLKSINFSNSNLFVISTLYCKEYSSIKAISKTSIVHKKLDVKIKNFYIISNNSGLKIT